MKKPAPAKPPRAPRRSSAGPPKPLPAPVELSLEELGARAHIIPGAEPPLTVTSNTIGPDGNVSKGRIIPVCEPRLDGNEEKYLMQAVRTNWISSAGPFVNKFEALFAEKVGAQHGVACSSGTTALHLALHALGVGRGDEVIVPAFTMIASPNAVVYTGAKPVLIDSEPETYNLDLSQLESKITPRTKAIMPVHTYGHPVDMDKLLRIARKYDLYVVSDSAESHGAEYKGRPVGSLGDLSAYSFYGNKIITTGEGGMLTTNSLEIAKLARTLRDHSFSKERHFWHKFLGFNFRLTNMQAAVGLAQTERFEFLVNCRRHNAELYGKLLASVPGLVLPPEKSWAKNVFWVYGILVQPEFGMSRDELRGKLAERGIETRTFFVPIHLQPIYFKAYGHQSFPVAEMLCERGMYLPSASTLTPGDIRFVAQCIRNVHKHGKT
jgi:perosamine synthetase